MIHEMKFDFEYASTRGENKRYRSAEVIKKGLADDGGLFVPLDIPQINGETIEDLAKLDYPQRAAKVLSWFLNDYNYSDLLDAAKKAYAYEKFGPHAAPLAKVGDNYFLELWHGPTSAFKDMALQIMPRLLSLALDMTNEQKDAYILVATSGYTGKAALEGYKDVPRVKIRVFYPVNGVSNIQKRQMASQSGSNVDVVAVNGNFDDAQTGVKAIFGDELCREKLAESGYFFSSANSINWGRLAPQIVYYISAYCDLFKEGVIKNGEKIDFVVPTGNFGDIFAGFLAKRMGLPVGKLVCASNKNDILTDFINTGVYDRRREFYTTVSPSMDILISSNLERLLWFVKGGEKTAEYMRDLAEKGIYSVDNGTMEQIRAEFAGFSCTEEETKAEIAGIFKTYGYLCDTHTAVAAGCARKYRGSSAFTGNKTVVLSTASPYKFAPAVLVSLGEEIPADDFEALFKLNSVTKAKIPKNLADLKNAEMRFDKTVEPSQMKDLF